jgi:cytochrome c peroxidase
MFRPLAGLAAAFVSALCLLVAAGDASGQVGSKSTFDSLNSSGVLRTITQDGTAIDTSNPFFRPLGSNGRSCSSCHVASSAWSITPAEIQARFERTGGLDPIFRTVDGSNTPNADVSTFSARRAAYSQLLSKGLIRVGRAIPAGAEFELVAVDDPYHFASAAELSLFRRSMPATNLRFLTGVMADEREASPQNGTTPLSITASPAANNEALYSDLLHQALDAVLGHAQASEAPDESTLQSIVAFEMNLVTAQQFDTNAGALTSAGAQGGPAFLASQKFYVTINDSLGEDVSGKPFNLNAMTLFNSWLAGGGSGGLGKARASIARGAVVFNTKPFTISGLGAPSAPGTCTSCHDSPNVGNYSVPLDLDMGQSDASARTPDMPLYTLRNLSTGATRQVTDPGLALTTGLWADIAKFRIPTMRGLAARPPYFHNGSAADLGEVLDFYDTRFSIGFTDQERRDLIAFLGSL